MEILVGVSELKIGGDTYPCTIGRSGFVRDKKEGDGGTPVGRYHLREVFYRADRIPEPESGLPVKALSKDDGWCDDPQSDKYNQLVTLPFPFSHEELFREDYLYDLIVVIGYNDDPVAKGAGSAIFMHVARHEFTPTDGCVGLELPALKSVVKRLTPETVMVLSESQNR